MKGLILAAGLGTRLRPLTLSHAKPSLPVLGVPALWFAAWHMSRELGMKALAMNVGHAPSSLREAGEDPGLKNATSISFHYSDESAGILGSSGALKKLAAWIGSDLLAVSNGDSISMPSWKRMLEFHRRKKAAMTLHIRGFEELGAESYTDIDVDQGGKIQSFGTKSKKGLMFAGSYLFEPHLLPLIPDGVSDIKLSLFDRLLEKGSLYAFREDGPWIDTGTISSYAAAQFELLHCFPEAKELVEEKMREIKPGCWVPRHWGPEAEKLELYAPVVLHGELADWTAHMGGFGPRFAGIKAPEPGSLKFPPSNALVFSKHLELLEKR